MLRSLLRRPVLGRYLRGKLVLALAAVLAVVAVVAAVVAAQSLHWLFAPLALAGSLVALFTALWLGVVR